MSSIWFDDSFTSSVERILGCTGRIVVCGMCKSGVIAKKIVATFAKICSSRFLCIPERAIMLI